MLKDEKNMSSCDRYLYMDGWVYMHIHLRGFKY